MGYLLPFDQDIELGQEFGSRPNLGPNPSGGHNGDDWLTITGTPVRAAGDGYVTFCGEFDSTYADNFGWNLKYGGKMVILNMDGETAPYFEYGHLSEILVTNGQRVVRGQIIALTGNTDGNTGVSSGPHCHVGCLPYNFDLSSNTYGRVNPRIYMTDYYEGDEFMTEDQLKQYIHETNKFNQATINARIGDVINEVRAHTAWNAAKVIDIVKTIPDVSEEVVATIKAEIEEGFEFTLKAK